MNTLTLEQLGKQIDVAIAAFDNSHDINQLLCDSRTILIGFVEELIVAAVEQLLSDRRFLTALKVRAAKSALRFSGFKQTSIRLLSGRSMPIVSPYFAKVAVKDRRGRKSKKRKTKSGDHLGLSYLGFIGRCSGVLTSSAVQAGLLCPSFEIAARTLHCFGITMNIKTIQRLCLATGSQAIKQRHRIGLSDADGVENRTLLICIDGGRLRERRAKRGRRPAGQKRQGYHTDWREPTQIVIQWLEANGERCKQTVPLYDATMADSDEVFQLLEDYLRQLDVSQSDLVIFCADGARRYWSRFSSLAQRLKINAHLEIIDYTHAKQNLQLVADCLPKKLGIKKLAHIAEDWKNLLWKGKLDEIHRQIRRFIKSSTKRKKALNKFKNYFLDNYERMQYASFRYVNVPTGSGCVESAIRRVINLRLKSPGIFWKRKTAEVMLFLRSTLLCGRWNIMLKNLYQINRGQFRQCH